MFPLNTVLFPAALLNLHIFEPRYRQMVAECLAAKEAFGVVLIREGDEAGDPDVQPHAIGTTAEIADVTPLPSGRYYLSCTGGRRFRINEVVTREPYLLCDVEFLDEAPGDPAAIQRLTSEIVGEFREYLSLIVEFSGSPTDVAIPAVAEDPVALAVHAGRMHKLRGSAGMLGAKSIQQLAGEAEAACAAGEVERASRLATRLATMLQRLHQSAAPVFMPARAQAEGAALPSGDEVEPQVLADIVVLLRQQSLSAVD